MKPFVSVLLLIATLGSSTGFDADLPKDKTLGWTVETGLKIIPIVDFDKVPIGKVIESMVPSNGIGYFIGIDSSAVKDRLNRPFSIHERNLPWIHLLGKIADALDADIAIGKGIYKLVPRKK